jgi:biotin operon repressor
MSIKELNASSKIILAEIISILRENSYCYVSNEYLAKRLGFCEKTVSNSVTELKKKEYINIKNKMHFRIITLNSDKLDKENIEYKKADMSKQNVNLSSRKVKSSKQNVNLTYNNNNYNNKYNSFNNTKSSYNLEELMKIR